MIRVNLFAIGITLVMLALTNGWVVQVNGNVYSVFLREGTPWAFILTFGFYLVGTAFFYKDVFPPEEKTPKDK